MSSKTQAPVNATTKPSLNADKSGLLQRQCACGNSAGLTGECATCQKEKLTLQRKQTAAQDKVSEVPPVAHEALSLPRVPFIQAKLTIGASDDPLEREADRVADQVMAAPTHSAVSAAPLRIQRFTGQATGQADMAAPASVDRVLSSPGSPLEPALQQDMEQRFGYDFSRVRIHTDAAAERSAREVNANAYTVGQDIVFGTGRFVPGTHKGRRLLAHELTHVVQQSGVNGISVGQSNGKWSRSPIISNTLSIGGSANGIRTVPVTRIQREEAAEDTKPRDESLGIGEKIVIEGLAAGASVGMPLLKPVIEGGFTGFYTEIRHQIKEGKGQQFMSRVKKLIVSPGDMVAYGKGYLWGILQGLWSPVQGLVDIAKLGWQLQQWQMQTLANVIQNFQEIVTMQGSLMDRFSKLGSKAKAFFDGIKGNALEFIGKLMGAVSGGVFELAKTGGHKAGQAIFKFLEKPWGEIGEGIGTVVGTVLIEVLLAVFSGGIGNALTKVGQALEKVAPTLMKGVRFIASELGTIITEIRGVVETIKAGLAKAGRSLLKGLEEFIGEAGSIFDDLIAMLKKLFSGAEDAAAKLPKDVPLPVKAPAPHIPAPHSPPVAKSPHVEGVSVKKPPAEPLVPKEPNVEVGTPKKSQVELTQPKEPSITKAPSDAVKVVEENPKLIKGETGSRRAPVGEGHEIVEVPDSSLPSGIGCELRSPPPGIKVRCPEGMGDLFDYGDVSVRNSGSGKGGYKDIWGKENPKTAAGKYAHTYDDILNSPEVLVDMMKRANVKSGIFSEPIPKNAIPEFQVPHPDYPAGWKPRIDRLVDRGATGGEIIEIKPNHLKSQGDVEAQQYAQWMDRFDPLPNGNKWRWRTITYDQKKLMSYLEKSLRYFE